MNKGRGHTISTNHSPTGPPNTSAKGSHSRKPATPDRTLLPVGGRLRHFRVSWHKLTSSQFARQAVSGLKLQLSGTPPLTSCYKAFDSAKGNSSDKCKALEAEISKLKQKCAIERAPASTGFYGRVFLVPKKDGSWRPVFNLRPLNKFVKNVAFKMATVRTVAAAIRPGDWAISLDFKDAYLHIPIHFSHRRFLRFVFRGKVYQFKVLPFGLSSAPRVFTKLTRYIVIHCRSLGLRLILYLDDSLLLARPKSLAYQHRDLLMALLDDLGFVINFAKSEIEPRQNWTYIGLDWSSATMHVAVPQDKLQQLHEAAQGLLDTHKPTCRKVQRFLGRANFSALGLPRARLHMRALQTCLRRTYKSVRDLFKPCPLSGQARKDLTWWLQPPVNGIPLSPALPDTTIATDASLHGWGAHWGAQQLHGEWSAQE